LQNTVVRIKVRELHPKLFDEWFDPNFNNLGSSPASSTLM